MLEPEPSAALRDQLVAEMIEIGENLALWAYRRLSAKNSLTADDARAVETSYHNVLGALVTVEPPEQGPDGRSETVPASAADETGVSIL